MQAPSSQLKTHNSNLRITALAGGVGGAKLAQGLQMILSPGALTVVVNTGDDFRLWGLHISPDIDTVMYTLAGIANPETGWGVAGDTWRNMDMLARYGRDPWFRLGDLDLATHILRTQMLHDGRTLTDTTIDLVGALDIPSPILPMCDEPVETLVSTEAGNLPFQDYFVRRRHADSVTGFTFKGIVSAQPTRQVLDAIEGANAIVFCPSNPFVSVGPIVAVPGMREALIQAKVPKVAVSPIVGGAALKGPAADMLAALGHEVSPYGVALLYRELLDGFIIDSVDAAHAPRIRDLGMKVHITATVMRTEEDRALLAQETLDFCAALP
jgi:LPPG:FO 2-phospho-L-lactate transferase